MKLRNLLGKCQWAYKSSPTDRIYQHGLEDDWGDPDSTVDQLRQVMPNYGQTIPETACFELRQWQKVGRRIQEVVVHRMNYRTGEIFDKQCEVI
ncbi:hypothetical protein Pla110_22390 [Polystyrenella longa]|uniref:Uncharacterized protein n=1 Tax=Polystyrenella longa TaxID=2528007 RepID=A0A518CMR0_9PLAN|nr:hypothetical protein [Polystyrenella longa]QDU80509.1 hypothetical protein Pla110_22390 [Polystyrenella longa]